MFWKWSDFNSQVFSTIETTKDSGVMSLTLLHGLLSEKFWMVSFYSAGPLPLICLFNALAGEFDGFPGLKNVFMIPPLTT